MKRQFSKEDTAICKGIAILLMVWHHLFYLNPEIPLFIGQMEGLPYKIGVFGKICVTIFTFLSGYGISKKANDKNLSFRSFQTNITLKLYKNYIFIVFITLGIFLCIPRLRMNYIGTGVVAVWRIALSVSGMEYWFLNMGINIVWWYISMILTCYILYPYCAKIIRRMSSVLIVLFCLIGIAFSNINIPRFGLFQIVSWGSVFFIGAVAAEYDWINRLLNIFDCSIVVKALVGILLVCSCVYRCIEASFALHTRYVDVLITIMLVLIVGWSSKGKLSKGRLFLGKMGKISMDIYFMHMIFCEYLFKGIIYNINDGIIMFIITMVLSVFSHYMLQVIRNVSVVKKILK